MLLHTLIGLHFEEFINEHVQSIAALYNYCYYRLLFRDNCKNYSLFPYLVKIDSHRREKCLKEWKYDHVFKGKNLNFSNPFCCSLKRSNGQKRMRKFVRKIIWSSMFIFPIIYAPHVFKFILCIICFDFYSPLSRYSIEGICILSIDFYVCGWIFINKKITSLKKVFLDFNLKFFLKSLKILRIDKVVLENGIGQIEILT